MTNKTTKLQNINLIASVIKTTSESFNRLNPYELRVSKLALKTYTLNLAIYIKTNDKNFNAIQFIEQCGFKYDATQN